MFERSELGVFLRSIHFGRSNSWKSLGPKEKWLERLIDFERLFPFCSMYVFGNGDISLVLVESESNKIRISAKTPAPYMCSATHQLVKGATCLELTDAPLGNIPGCGPDIKVIPVIRTNSNRMRFVFKILHPLQKNPPREVLLLTNKNLDRCELYSRLRTGVLRRPLEDGHR